MLFADTGSDPQKDKETSQERSKFSRRTEGSRFMDKVSEQCVISMVNVARLLPVFCSLFVRFL